MTVEKLSEVKIGENKTKIIPIVEELRREEKAIIDNKVREMEEKILKQEQLITKVIDTLNVVCGVINLSDVNMNDRRKVISILNSRNG